MTQGQRFPVSPEATSSVPECCLDLGWGSVLLENRCSWLITEKSAHCALLGTLKAWLEAGPYHDSASLKADCVAQLKIRTREIGLFPQTISYHTSVSRFWEWSMEPSPDTARKRLCCAWPPSWLFHRIPVLPHLCKEL